MLIRYFDDYISKPFSPGELVARVKAHFRSYMHLSALPPEQILKIGKLEIDNKAYIIKIDGQEVKLAVKEFEQLSFMAHHPLQVFTREQLFNQIWGFDEYGDINTVTVHIRKIREKIEEKPSDPMGWGLRAQNSLVKEVIPAYTMQNYAVIYTCTG